MITSVSGSEPIRVFIGSSPKNAVEEAVFRYTLQKHAGVPVEIHAINGKTGSVTNLTTQEVKQLPPSLIERVPGATAFSLARWAIPEWCDYQGRAIYCDSDQVVIADIAELWNIDLAGHTLAAVPVKAAKCQPNYRKTILKNYLESSEDFYLASVMVLDCERAKTWSLTAIVDWVDQKRRANIPPNMMMVGQSFREAFQIDVMALPPEWNHLDWVDATSKLVHFTDLTSQPWRFHHNPTSTFWETLYLEAIDQGYLSLETVSEAYAQGWINRRIKALAKAPKASRGLVNALWRQWSAFNFTLGRLVNKVGRRLRVISPQRQGNYAG